LLYNQDKKNNNKNKVYPRKQHEQQTEIIRKRKYFCSPHDVPLALALFFPDQILEIATSSTFNFRLNQI